MYEIDVKKLEITNFVKVARFGHEIAKLAICIVSHICFVYKMYEVIFFLFSPNCPSWALFLASTKRDTRILYFISFAQK